jgi:hypothetical protein
MSSVQFAVDVGASERNFVARSLRAPSTKSRRLCNLPMYRIRRRGGKRCLGLEIRRQENFARKKSAPAQCTGALLLV